MKGFATHADEVHPGAGSLGRRVRRYQAIVLWLLRDGTRHFGRRMAAVAAMDALALLSQLAALALLYVYVNSVAAGRSLPDGPLDLPMADPVSTLGFAVLVLFALFAGAAVLDYRAKVLGYDLGLLYGRLCHRRLLGLAGRLPHPAAPLASEALRNRRTARDLFRTPDSCGTALQLLLQSANPIGTVAIVALVLLVRNPAVFAVVAALSLAMLLLVYRTHLRAAEHGARSRTLAPLARSADRRLWSLTLNAPGPAMPEQPGGEADRTSEADAYRGAIRARQLAGERGNLVAGLLVSIVLAAILGLEGATLLSEPTRWGELLLYLVTLRYGLAALKRLVAILNQFNRQYPRLRPYYEFVADAERTQTAPTAEAGGLPLLSLRALDGVSERLALGANGRILALLHPEPLDRFTKLLFHDLERRQDPDAAKSRFSEYWSAARLRCAGLTPRQCFGFAPDYSTDDLRADVARLAGDPNGETWLPELDRVIAEDDKARLNRRTSSLLRVIAAIRSHAGVILLSSRDLPYLHNRNAEAAGAALAGRTAIIAYDRLTPRIGRFGETALLVSNGRRLLGWAPMEWVRARPEELSRLTGLKIVAAKRTDGDSGDDDDEEETA